MSEYKLEDTKFLKKRITNIIDFIENDMNSGVDQETNSEEIDPNLFGKYMDLISTSCTDSFALSEALHQALSLNNINLSHAIIHSSFLPEIMNILQKNPTAPLIQAIRDLTYFSSSLTYILFHFDFIRIIFNCVLSQDLEISYEALKFLQKIIPYGMTSRAALYGCGILDVIFIFLQNPDNSSLFSQAAHTALLFIIYDPVYGVNSYAKASDQPKRSIVMNQCREINIPPKLMLNISSFLKHGNGTCPNKPLYHLINLLLESGDEELCFYGIKIVEVLSEYCKENAIKIVESTQFFKFAELYFNCNVDRIQIPIFNIIINIIYYTGDTYEKKIIKLKPFYIGLDIISSEDAPVNLKVSAGCCIFYGVNYIDSIQKEFTENEIIFKNLLNVFENSQMAVKNEACCIIISIIFNCHDKKRVDFLSIDLVLSFLSFLGSYDDEQLLKILRLFITLFAQYFDEMSQILCNEEVMEIFVQLSTHENKEIACLSNTLINLISPPPNVDEDE